MKKQLIVDIGRFAISYSVINKLDYRLEYFKIELMSDIDYLFTKRGTSFISKIVDVTRRIIATEQTVDEVVFVIPSKEVLLVSSAELTPTIIAKETHKIFNVDLNGDLAQAVAEPYTHRGKYYTPVTIYDRTLDILIKEIDTVDTVSEVNDENRLRAEVNFQTTMGRLMEKAKITNGKVAIIDAGYSSTRVLLSDDGIPTNYIEFPELNGESMLQYVYSKTEIKLTDIVNILMNSESIREGKVNTGIKELNLADEYIRLNNQKLIDYLTNLPLDNIIIYGGLGAMNIIEGIEHPFRVVKTDRHIQVDVPLQFDYRIVYNTIRVNPKGILSRENLDVITGKSRYKEVVGIEEKQLQTEGNGREKQRKKEDNKSVKETKTGEIDYKTGKMDDSQNVMPSQNNSTQNIKYDQTKKGVKSSKLKKQEDANTPMPEPILDILENDSKVMKKKLKNISIEDNKQLDKLKKNQKTYSKWESKMPSVIVAILMTVLLIFIVLMMNEFGFVNIKVLERVGIVTEERTNQVNGIIDAVKRTVNNVCKDFELHTSRVGINSNFNLSKKVISMNIGVPLDFENYEKMTLRLEKRIKGLVQDDNNISTEIKTSEEQGYNYLRVKIKLED